METSWKVRDDEGELNITFPITDNREQDVFNLIEELREIAWQLKERKVFPWEMSMSEEG